MTTEEALMERVKEVIEDEFSAEGFTVEYDKIGRSAGMEIASGARVAFTPDDAIENPRNVVELVVRGTLQLYMAYDAEPDETIVVDPTTIVQYAGRIRAAFKDSSSGDTDELWFCRMTGVIYPDDPTGNKSRLEARILAFGQNEAGMP